MAEQPRTPMDFRERLGYMIVALVVMVFVMIYTKPALTQNDGFMLLAQAIVISALIGGVVAWGYSQNKDSNDQNRTMRRQADALVAASDPAWRQPAPVTVVAEEATVTGDPVTVATPPAAPVDPAFAIPDASPEDGLRGKTDEAPK